MTEKWGEIQEKWGLVWVSGEFELSKFELPGFFCIFLFFSTKKAEGQIAGGNLQAPTLSDSPAHHEYTMHETVLV